jgi:type III secretion protein J
MRRTASILVAVLSLAGCGGEAIQHGLEEAAANEILVALDEAGIAARKEREDGPEAAWVVSVAPADAARAQRVLSERELPRARAPGFGDVFGKGSMVPTPTEEHALYLHALAGELSRSVEAIDGVVEARVHLGLPQPDPLRPSHRPAPRGAVLVKCRPPACEAVHALEDGIRSLVAGAADGLEAGAVAVVIAPAAQARPPPGAPRRNGSRVLLALAAVAGAGALGLAGVSAHTWWRRRGGSS